MTVFHMTQRDLPSARHQHEPRLERISDLRNSAGLRTVRLPLVRAARSTRAAAPALGVAIVNDTFARRFWPRTRSTNDSGAGSREWS